eukprot:TRINITY_DN15263_c0_g1_i1.p1 TRINITY_DN15263_c0_g1~~TRINITY_DN15263_c0_g1_i1.p1  ORF type:complete len:545 (+),score=80.48 TRINITY_DN15263_c0_g1_i1:91-1725(+)
MRIVHAEDLCASRRHVVTGRYLASASFESDYVLTNTELGDGCGGEVMVAKASDGSQWAVKKCLKENLPDEGRRRLEKEIAVNLMLDHPHVVSVERVYESESAVYLVMELLSGGDLCTWLMRGFYPEDKAARLARQMLLALAYLHELGVAHRDVKPENFLFEDQRSERIKLIDFGFAGFLSKEPFTETMGTHDYVAPDVLDGSYTEKADLWSFGITVFCMVTGRLPFHGCSPSETLNNVRRCSNRWESRLSHLSTEGKDFVRSLIVKDPLLRPSAESLINHPWIVCNTAQSQAVLERSVFQNISNFTCLSRFRRACLSVLASSASPSSVAELRELFLVLSDAGKGAITLEQFARCLESMCQVERSASVEMLRLLDEDGDGKIYYTEFLAAAMHDQARIMRADVVRRTFDHFDAEGTGLMSLDNVKRVLGNSLNEQDVQDLFCGLCEVHEGAADVLDDSHDSSHVGYIQPPMKSKPSPLDHDQTWESDETPSTVSSPAFTFGVLDDGHKAALDAGYKSKQLELDDDCASVSTMSSPNFPFAHARNA